MENLKTYQIDELIEWEVLLISGGHQGTSYNVGYAIGEVLGLCANVVYRIIEFKGLIGH